MRVAGLKASVIRAKGGKFDFEDLLGAAGAKKPAAAPAKPAKVKFDVAGIQLANGTLAYKDEGSGQTLEVAHLELRTGRIAEDVPGKMSLGAQLKGKQPLVDAKVALESGYRFSLARQEYALEGLSLKVEGAAADFSRLELALSGDVRADVAKESVNAELTAKFDETTIKGKAAMAKFDARPLQLRHRRGQAEPRPLPRSESQGEARTRREREGGRGCAGGPERAQGP